MLSLRDELFCTLAKFVLRCFASNNSIVNFFWLGMVFILEGCTLKSVSTRSFVVSVTMCHCIVLAALTESRTFRDLSNYYRSNAGIVCELLLARSGLGVISSLSVADMDFITHYLCVSFLANVNSSSCSLYVIGRPSVCLSSVVCNVGAPYSGD